jgi:hypothetical protein
MTRTGDVDGPGWSTLQEKFCVSEVQMTRKKPNPDLVLRLKGLDVPNGALSGDDLFQLAKLLKALEDASPDLRGGYLVSVSAGSSRPAVCFPNKPASSFPGMNPKETSLLGIFKDGGFSKDEGWKAPRGVRESLRHWGNRGVAVSVTVPMSEGKAYIYRFTPKRVKEFSAFVAEEPVRKVIQGKLRALDGADSEFELHFDHHKLICPFPPGPRPTGFYYEKFVEAVVWVKSRPVQGPWKATATDSIRLLPEAPHLEMEGCPEGMIPPAIKLMGGFHLDHFFNGPTPDDVEEFCGALCLNER